MNREEVIEVLTSALDGLGTAWKVDEAISAAIKLLAADANVARKDPIAGLAPCGCGGRVEIHFSGYEPDDYYVVCEQCHVGTWDVTGEENAKRVWNTAIGGIDI